MDKGIATVKHNIWCHNYLVEKKKKKLFAYTLIKKEKTKTSMLT